MLIFGILLLSAFVGTASATTWYVDDDGGADFTRVQDTVDDASAGGTIIVHRGHDGGSPNTHVNANNQGFLWLELPNPLNIISVAVAQEQVPCDPFADSYCYLNCDGSFNAVEKSVNEPIFDPREIEERLWGDLDTLHIDKYLRQEKNLNGAVWYDKEGYAHYDIFKISEMDAAVWLDKHWGIGCGELESARQIYPIDTDGDGIADTLMCGLHKSYLRNTDLGPISDSIVRCDDGYYLLDLFHTPENKSLQRDYREYDQYFSILQDDGYDHNTSLQGGVFPDIQIKDDRYPPSITELISKGIFFQFSRKLMTVGIPISKNFSIDAAITGKFKKFLKEKQIQFSPELFKKHVEIIQYEIKRDILIIAAPNQEASANARKNIFGKKICLKK